MIKRTMGQAIRAYCLQCSNHSKKEVALCPMNKCPLYPFRLKPDQEEPPHQQKSGTENPTGGQPVLFE